MPKPIANRMHVVLVYGTLQLQVQQMSSFRASNKQLEMADARAHPHTHTTTNTHTHTHTHFDAQTDKLKDGQTDTQTD